LTRNNGWLTLKVTNSILISNIEYLKKVKAKLEENGKADRVPGF
jgi:hypothetical protein